MKGDLLSWMSMPMTRRRLEELGLEAGKMPEADPQSVRSMQPGIGRDGLLDTTGGTGSTTVVWRSPRRRRPWFHSRSHKPHACHMHAGHGSSHGDADSAAALD